MTDTGPTVASEGSSPDKCSAARHRRIQIRRLTATPGDSYPWPGCGSPSHGGKRRKESDVGAADKRSRRVGSRAQSCPGPPPPLVAASPRSSSPSGSGSGGAALDLPFRSGGANEGDRPPAFGSVSVSGRSREMEDAVSLRPGFFTRRADGGLPMHFFAVFDGHGGSQVSALCKERMHTILAEELQRASSERGGGGEITVDEMTAATARCFRRVDDLALAASPCGGAGDSSPVEPAGLSSEIVGSTAVVAVVDRDRVVVANCGDSRAVLSRGGRAVPLSSDHKPDRPDELARIEEAGGRVIHVDGARVLGILAMSRALGDGYLKPVVISDPEISITERNREDEFLIIASDGLWDVLSNELACDVTRRCLHDGIRVARMESLVRETDDGVAEEQSPESYCSMAAALLTRLALGRRSADNISVIVVDLTGGRGRL